MRQSRVPENTGSLSQDKIKDMLVEGMVLGGDFMIGRQEAQGQRTLVESDTLPTEGLDAMRPAIEAAGGTIGVAVEGDPMFTFVTLPPGWEKRAAPDHSMWSYLYDDKGRKRAAIFYKAAFYDRHADIRPESRFSFSFDWERFDKTKEYVVNICDGETVIDMVSGELQPGAEEYYFKQALRAEAERRLVGVYPNWADPNAYWD